MAFKIYKGAGGGMEVPTERWIAGVGGVTANMPVILAAGTTGAELGKVTQAAGGSAATELIYGVALETGAAGVEVLVAPALGGTMWEVDSAADANVLNVGVDNYLAATTLLLTVGASTVQGRKCVILGKLGTAANRKYLVRLVNTTGV